MAFAIIGTFLAAYFLGSVNFAVIFTKCFTKSDIRDYGSGNAGATNVLRVGGIVPGILTFLCDALKGFAACLIGKAVFGYVLTAHPGLTWAFPIYGAYACGLICMIGHVFPLFYQFRGGKGVAVSVGIYAVCCPKAIIIGLVVFALVTLISKTVSVGSLIATVVVISLSIIFKNSSIGLFSNAFDINAGVFPQAILSIFMGIIIIIKHIPNIKRIISGEEKHIKVRRK